MTISKVIRDSTGKVINIGEWDFMEEITIDPITSIETTIIHNPIPDGTVESQEEVKVLTDGGLTTVN